MDCSVCTIQSRIPTTGRPTRRPSQTLVSSDEDKTFATVYKKVPRTKEWNSEVLLKNAFYEHLDVSYMVTLHLKFQDTRKFLLYNKKDWLSLGVRWLQTVCMTPHWLFLLLQDWALVDWTLITYWRTINSISLNKFWFAFLIIIILTFEESFHSHWYDSWILWTTYFRGSLHPKCFLVSVPSGSMTVTSRQVCLEKCGVRQHHFCGVIWWPLRIFHHIKVPFFVVCVGNFYETTWSILSNKCTHRSDTC